MSCYRFSQRLRVSLRNWCRQTLPTGSVEVLVANPQSPDGTHELLAAMTSAYSDVRLFEVPIDGGMARNKGFMMNRAVDASRGEWIWFTDADCLFPLHAAEHALSRVDSTSTLYYGERRHLSRRTTDSLLAGCVDAGPDFDSVSSGAYHSERFPWGYTQIIHRSLATTVRYREDVDNFSTSDGTFIEDCRDRGVPLCPIPGLSCLHLSHPFAWYGTGLYL
jgi:glycosyltransferase involved in cell wall biosynthesis